MKAQSIMERRAPEKFGLGWAKEQRCFLAQPYSRHNVLIGKKNWIKIFLSNSVKEECPDMLGLTGNLLRGIIKVAEANKLTIDRSIPSIFIGNVKSGYDGSACYLYDYGEEKVNDIYSPAVINLVCLNEAHLMVDLAHELVHLTIMKEWPDSDELEERYTEEITDAVLELTAGEGEGAKQVALRESLRKLRE